MSDDFEDEVRTAFTEQFDADPDVAADAAAKMATFREEVDEDLTVETLVDAVTSADDYETFAHRYDLAIGTLAAENEDCTDSRAYRLAGFDDLAADPEIGA